ncbi:MAG: putative transport system permease protein [Solirubrobacteraceae bacterium]|nr:putative transport system permease protein [Solirubrobacteraceae bacterium]
MRQVALRGLRARPLRTILTAMAVVLGVAMISGTYVLTDTINKSFSEVFTQANSGTDVVINPSKVDDAFDASPPPLKDSLVQRVRAVKGVRAAGGGIQGDVSIRTNKGHRIGGSVNLVLSLQPKPLDPFTFVTGRAPRSDSEVALSAKAFADEGLKVGDLLTVVGEQGAKRFRLVGSARFGDVDTVAGYPAAIVTLPTAQALTGRQGQVDTIAVAALDGVTPPQLRASVGAALAGEPVEVRTGAQDAAQQTKDFKKSFGFIRTILLVFGGIALFVGAFVIYNTFTITVAQRTRELALLRTLGASRRQVLRSVVLEAGVIGFLASVLGLLGGLALAPGLRGLLKIIGADLPSTASVILPRTIVVALLVGVVVTILASVVPALRATRIAPIVALREGLTAAPLTSRKRIVFAALLCLAGGGILVYGLFGGASGSGAAATLGGGAVMVFLGVALFSPQLVKPIAWVIGAPLQRVAGVSGRLARENATRNPARTATTAAALMIGVALVAFVSIFAAGLRGSIDGAVDRAFTGDLSVVDKSGFGTTPPALVGAIRKVPGVAAVSGIRFAQAKVGSKTGTTSVSGIDPATIAQTYTLKWKQGSDATLRTLGSDGVLADTGFSKKAKVGDRIRLLTPAGRHVTYTVKGLLDEGSDFGLLGGGLVLPNDRLAADFDTKKDSFVFLRYAQGAPVAATRASIDRLLATRFPDAETQDRGQVKDSQAGKINQILYLIYALLALSIIVSLFGILNTLALSIFERTRELGLLRAIGTSRRQVKRIVRLEAVITSLIGALLGLVLGVLFALAISRPLVAEGFRLTFPVTTLVALVAAAAAAGMVASLWPARRAARLDVLAALAYE